MKKAMLLMALVLSTGGFAAERQMSSQAGMNTSSSDISSLQGTDCQGLSAPEKDFAQRLSDTHRSIFCTQFNGNQRAETLALMVSKSAKYKDLTPDEAVEMVIKNSRKVPVREAGRVRRSERRRMRGTTPPPPRSSETASRTCRRGHAQSS